MPVGQATRQQGEQQGHLPAEMTSFVGREPELARLSALLRRARLVTVTGPAGVGKTRLALRAAAKAAPCFSDGVCLVDLSGLDEPGLLVPAVNRALGVPEPDGGSSLDVLLTELGDRCLLLILDTCEHLIDECAIFAEAVIARAPGVTLLATSREPLDLIGEHACPIGALPVPQLHDADTGGTAVDLFLQRAAAAVPGFTAGPEDLRHVIAVCQRLDGIPLALEMAAVRLRALPLTELASRLDHCLPLLTSGHRGSRHKTLRDAIGWSHALCTPAERDLWARLSVFAGPFTLRAAEEVCAGQPGVDRDQVMPTVIRLVDKSLLIRVEPAADGPQPTQYLMPGTFRQFGAEQLAGADAEPGTKDRFVARYVAMATSFRDRFLDDGQLARLSELRREHANVSAALEYALSDCGDDEYACGACAACDRVADGLELATALSSYWRARGLGPEGVRWLGKALVRAPEGSAFRGRALLGRSRLLAVHGGAAEALAHADEALEIAAALGDEHLAARGNLVRGVALLAGGQLGRAAEANDVAERLLTALGDQAGLADLAAQQGCMALLDEDIDATLGHVEHGLRMLGESRERCLHSNLYLLASLALCLAGRDTEAAWAATRALQVKQEIGDLSGATFSVELLGWLAARSGGHQRAAWLLGGADPLWDRLGGRLAALPHFERLHTDAVARSQRALGSPRFAELFARAARRPADAVIAFALSDGAADSGSADAGQGARPRDQDMAPPDDGSGAGIDPAVQLTTREQEIATLVAAGLSNRQIAEKLFISRRTVDAHLEHIFGKLGITSRVMLTIQLREHSALTESGASA
jgi:predicted ATPase/DNA-binding CsgD family transcriptional regulator